MIADRIELSITATLSEDGWSFTTNSPLDSPLDTAGLLIQLMRNLREVHGEKFVWQCIKEYKKSSRINVTINRQPAPEPAQPAQPSHRILFVNN